MNHLTPEKSISKRAQILFKALVERYIREGQPVGSKTLADELGASLSPATIRNVLADLEEQGLLHSPHTSAGRIPTDKGYRLFVDSLLTVQPISQKEVSKVQQELSPGMESNKLIAAASSLLSKITSLTGLVTIPKQRHLLLTHVEFLPLSANRILVVLVINGREVQNRIIHTHRVFSVSELQQASNYLNAHFAGKDLSRLKRELKNKMQQDKHEIDQLLQTAIDVHGAPHNDFVMSGEAHLFDFADASDMGQLRELFSAFTQKHDILHLLDQCIQTQGVQLFIGEESRYKPLDDYSLVTSPYSVDGHIVGVLAVIGPTRMAYDRIIPLVDITAKLLSSALNQDK
jgi:heat-inducible transcriptional repressor